MGDKVFSKSHSDTRRKQIKRAMVGVFRRREFVTKIFVGPR